MSCRSIPAFAVMVSLLLVSAVTPHDALAAKRKSKKKSPSSLIVNTEVDGYFERVGKTNVFCYQETNPGTTKTTKEGLTAFTSFSKAIKSATKKGQRAKVAKLKSLQRKAKKQCKNRPQNDLDKFKGSFGREEATILCNRFLFGCSPEDVDRAVAEGLDAFVNRVTTHVSEPGLEADGVELRCDGRLPSDSNNEECDPYDPNDLYTPGLRYDMYRRILRGSNRFTERLLMFFHDDRGAVNLNSLNSCERHAGPAYVDMVRQAAITGDAIQYIEGFSRDHAAAIRYLNLDGSYKDAPNEDQGRELLELETMSPFAIDGSPIYADTTIARMALALTGWLIEGRTEYPAGGSGDGYYVCRAGYFEGRHAQGPKVLFEDSADPHPMTVYDYRDAPRKLFSHPHTAIAWAKDIWLEFINPNPSRAALEDLAKIIRDNNFQLRPVFRKIMTSKAMFDPGSRNSLLKYPMEIILGLSLQTGVPVVDPDRDRPYSWTDDLLSDVGQRPFIPPSVFGWFPEKLAGEFSVLDRRNAVNEIFSFDLEEAASHGYRLEDRYMQSLTNAPFPARIIIDRVSGSLGVTLNEAQTAQLDRFMNNDLEGCWQGRPGCVSGQQYLEVADLFDARPAAYPDNTEKVRHLISIIANLPQYYTK